MNTMHKKSDIIVAQATPYGRSAVAIIRISGDGSKELVSRRLKKKLEHGKLAVNTFIAQEFTENLMAVCFDAPKSYTGEEVVELFPHGNPTVCDGIMSALVADGARMATRGEFTKRAFLNGKVNLMQCEALADIIDAQTAEQLRYGNARYDSKYKSLEEVEKSLNDALGRVEAALHYGDELEGEDIDGLDDEVKNAVESCISRLEREMSGFAGGKIVNDGFKVALIGEPNVGKSTLLNAMIGSDRAIVTPIAGTTRDVIDGEYVYNGRKFVIIDTAGLKEETSDEVERIGIDMAKAAATAADAVIFMTANGKTTEKIRFSRGDSQQSVAVCNKCDETKDFCTDYRAAESGGIMQISAKNGINITALKQKLYDLCPKDYGCICNDRQFDCVVRCLDSLKAAQTECEKSDGLEIVAAVLYEAYTAILDLYGEKADEKIISSVFERFCVGK